MKICEPGPTLSIPLSSWGRQQFPQLHSGRGERNIFAAGLKAWCYGGTHRACLSQASQVVSISQHPGAAWDPKEFPRDLAKSPCLWPAAADKCSVVSDSATSWTVASQAPLSTLQFSSVAQLCQTLCDSMDCSMPGLAVHHQLTNSRSSLRLTSIESVIPSSHLILCRPLLLLPPIPPSIRVFSNESTLLMRWPKYWSFSFRIIPSKEHP